MASPKKIVTSAEELLASLRDANVREIVVRGALSGLSSLRLAPGQAIEGEDEEATLAFAAGRMACN